MSATRRKPDMAKAARHVDAAVLELRKALTADTPDALKMPVVMTLIELNQAFKAAGMGSMTYGRSAERGANDGQETKAGHEGGAELDPAGTAGDAGQPELPW